MDTAEGFADFQIIANQATGRLHQVCVCYNCSIGVLLTISSNAVLYKLLNLLAVLARSANLPEGIYILLALISSFFLFLL